MENKEKEKENEKQKEIRLEASIGYKKPLFSIQENFAPGIYGIIGPTGCGKSTFLKTISKLIPVFQGTLQNPYQSILCLQEPVLLEEISLLDNLYFALGSLKREEQAKEKVEEIL